MLTHNGCSWTSSAALQPVSRQAPPELTAQRLRRLCLSCRRSCSRSGGLGLIISCRLAALLWWAAHALLLRRTTRFLLGLRLLKEAGESILLFVVVRLVVVPLSLGGGLPADEALLQAAAWKLPAAARARARAADSAAQGVQRGAAQGSDAEQCSTTASRGR